MGRPRKKAETVTINVKLTLTVGKDDDLISRFESLPSRGRAQWVKDVLEGNTSIVAASPDIDAETFDDLASLVL